MAGKQAISKGFQDRRYRELIRLLVEERRRLGWSQETLAARIDRHQQFVSRCEIGERRLDVVEFADIAAALGLDASQLIKNLDTEQA